MYSLPQKLFAEFVGTFTLIFAGAGAVCADQYLHAAGSPGIGLLGIAIASGIAYAVMIASIGHISGGHLNPAVTIGFWVTKRLSTHSAISYTAAQLAGASAGAYLLAVAVPESIWGPVGLGTPVLAADFTRMHGMAIEAVLTFFLVFVFFATVVDSSGAPGKPSGIAAGLTLTLGILVGGPFTGASLNPARAFGPALAVQHHWANHGVYWVGPLFGGIIAAVIYDRLFLRDQLPG
ncbi:MAG: MIP/aquaporin family protein [Candidatus Acidiferrales bacterium]